MADIAATRHLSWWALHKPDKSTMFVFGLVVFLAFYIVYPTFLIVLNSFNTAAGPQDPFVWGLGNWVDAFTKPGLLIAIWHTVLLWFLYTAISFPVSILIAWSLARLPIPGSHTLEFMFWISSV